MPAKKKQTSSQLIRQKILSTRVALGGKYLEAKVGDEIIRVFVKYPTTARLVEISSQAFDAETGEIGTMDIGQQGALLLVEATFDPDDHEVPIFGVEDLETIRNAELGSLLAYLTNEVNRMLNTAGNHYAVPDKKDKKGPEPESPAS